MILMNAATITQVLSSRYGVSATAADPLTIEWACDFALDNGLAIDSAKREIRKINAARRRIGKIPFYAPYGSRMF